ncbi:MAG: hypothetical protein ACRDUV_25850 [Pseudonocardiaceae bacterium]
MAAALTVVSAAAFVLDIAVFLLDAAGVAPRLTGTQGVRIHADI